jgi:hypothetical protein
VLQGITQHFSSLVAPSNNAIDAPSSLGGLISGLFSRSRILPGKGAVLFRSFRDIAQFLLRDGEANLPISLTPFPANRQAYNTLSKPMESHSAVAFKLP